jgi:hypothetical protein
MYIHKIVIDANRINAKGGQEAMNQLEAYHDAGLIELLKTSTLNNEFSKDSNFRKKAEKYQTISGNGYMAGLDGGHPEVLQGGIIGKPFFSLFRKIFPEKKTGKDLRNSIRDSLHIEQAILNYCDYFITDEKRLKQGGKDIPEINDRITVISDEACLEDIRNYFLTHYGSADPEILGNELKTTGPIILGSNSCHGFRVADSTTRDLILSAHIENGELLVNAVFFDDEGTKQLEIIPRQCSVFSSDALSISCGGRGGIVIGESAINHFMIGSENKIRLAARVTHVGRVVFFIVSMNGRNPGNFISVERDCLTLQGVEFG